MSEHHENDAPSVRICARCGHDEDPHRFCGYGEPPVEGWIECPVEGCDCSGTWSFAPDLAEQIRAMNEKKVN